jgi:hypothetical protein
MTSKDAKEIHDRLDKLVEGVGGLREDFAAFRATSVEWHKTVEKLAVDIYGVPGGNGQEEGPSGMKGRVLSLEQSRWTVRKGLWAAWLVISGIAVWLLSSAINTNLQGQR